MKGLGQRVTLLELDGGGPKSGIRLTASCHRLRADSNSAFYTSGADLVCNVLDSLETRGAEPVDR